MSSGALLARLKTVQPARRYGYVSKVSPSHLDAIGPMARVGDICTVQSPHAPAPILAEVSAVLERSIVLIPLDQTVSVAPDARVELVGDRSEAPVGDAFAGRAVDAWGDPIDGGRAPCFEARYPLAGRVLAPMDRVDPNEALDTGVRALDTLLTLGRGQRVGIFSASGVGKTTLMRQLATQVVCDHVILCLVGERGREVQDIWRDLSERAGRARFTCVAATSDVSSVLRARAVNQALCLAEYWRDAAKHVLLIIDSATRLAMALREIGLAAGAPPSLRAYTPNVFAALPRIVERCGAAKAGGAITTIMTVLSETDDVDDPIVETMKSLLDGHIVLSRELADQGRRPAIDIARSVSRQAPQLMTAPLASAARRALALTATYEEARLMIESGVYKAGANAKIDEAVRERDALIRFLSQGMDEHAPASAAARQLQSLMTRVKAHV